MARLEGLPPDRKKRMIDELKVQVKESITGSRRDV
jgi:hypothetical protein